MVSPMMTVVVLAVLWLIVVIPMLIKRSDDRAGERSVARFGGAMRSLSSRSLGILARPIAEDEQENPAREARASRAARAQVFVPGGSMNAANAARQPVPAAMEAVMYPDRVAKEDLSQARRQMMARRRRSLFVLGLGTIAGLLWGVAVGGMLAWGVGVLFTAGLVGYLGFLRNQALRDRDRRQTRLSRSGSARAGADEATQTAAFYAGETAVRIDDEDAELRGLADTVDLTGLYVEEPYDDRAMRRAV
jgi:hypothetical protein